MKACPRCGELLGDNADKCFKCYFDFNNPNDQIALEQQRCEERAREIDDIKQKHADILKINDLYEYDVVTVYDNPTGAANIEALSNALTVHAKEGWRLVTAVTNELGRNSSRYGAGGISSGENATIDETVLIFERCIVRYKCD